MRMKDLKDIAETAKSQYFNGYIELESAKENIAPYIAKHNALHNDDLTIEDFLYGQK